MDKSGYIEIRVSGMKGNHEISPTFFDIQDLKPILGQAPHLLFPDGQAGRPVISYTSEPGSVRHRFHTHLQAVIGFDALLLQIAVRQSIDFLEQATAKAIEYFQSLAHTHQYEITLSTSMGSSHQLKLNARSNYIRSESTWGNAEFYFYGTVIMAGGKTKPSIHLDTPEYGVLSFALDKETLMGFGSSILYSDKCIRATGRQHGPSGEIDFASLVLEEIKDFQPRYDPEYLGKLRQEAMWVNEIDPEEWLREIRGSDDE